MIKVRVKKGQFGIVMFFVFLFLILIIGFIAAFATGFITYANDQIQPTLQNLGVVGDSNLTAYAQSTFVPANNFINALPWLIGLGYVAMILFSIFFAISYSFSPHPFFIGFYLFLVILLIFGSIIISNMYQDIYSGTDAIALQLQSMTLLSFLVLESPLIFSIIAFITGIFMFIKPTADTGGGAGFGI